MQNRQPPGFSRAPMFGEQACNRQSRRLLRNLWNSIGSTGGGGASVTIESVIDRIVLLSSPEAVWEEARQYFAGEGFDRLIYADFTSRMPVLRNSFPEHFGRYYSDVCNPAHDPFFRYCCSTLAPLGTGLDYIDDHDYLTAPERKIIETAREAGMRAGFSCTVQVAGASGTGGWNIGSTQGRREVEALRRKNGTTLRLVALYAHERMTALHGGIAGKSDIALSPREHDCLAHLAAGMKTQQIADRLDIKPVTVELHLRRARERLGARTREQALAKALSLRLLRL